jgi:hypothetical protein
MFTAEKNNKKLTFLVLTLTNQSGQLEFQIYRKHILIDLIITNHFCRPFEHKRAGKNYLMKRVNTNRISIKG